MLSSETALSSSFLVFVLTGILQDQLYALLLLLIIVFIFGSSSSRVIELFPPSSRMKNGIQIYVSERLFSAEFLFFSLILLWLFRPCSLLSSEDAHCCLQALDQVQNQDSEWLRFRDRSSLYMKRFHLYDTSILYILEAAFQNHGHSCPIIFCLKS